MLRVFAVSGAALMLAGCAATHQSKVGQSTTDASQGRLQDAIAKVDAQLKGDKANDVLLNLEKGELLRISSNYSDSMASFEIADGAVKQWEEGQERACRRGRPDRRDASGRRLPRLRSPGLRRSC